MNTSAAYSTCPILLYHAVSGHVSRRFARWNIEPGLFAEHAAYLASESYATPTISDLMSEWAGTSPTDDRKRVAITFDDAFADFTAAALPELTRHGLSTTLYVPTAFVGRTSTWLAAVGEADRLILSARELADLPSLVECGAHGHDHVALDVLPSARVRADVLRSKAELESMIGRDVQSFSYPFGFSRRATRQIVADAGFESACGVRYRTGNSGDERLFLPRIQIGPRTTTAQLARLLSGAPAEGASRRERWRSCLWRTARNSVAGILVR